MAITITNPAGQAQQGLQADYYQMEGWETTSDDVSGSGNLNYQEVELKIDKDLLTFGNEGGGDYDAEPAIMRMRGAEEASFVSRDDAPSVRELMTGGNVSPITGGDALDKVEASLESLGVAPLSNPDAGSNVAISNNSTPSTSSGGGGSSATLNNSDNDTSTTTTTNVTNGGDGCCDIDISIVVNATTINNAFYGGDVTGGDIINVDITGGDGGDINIFNDIDIDLGDVINNIITIGDGGINIDIDNTLSVLGGDITTIVNLGLGDGVHVDVDLGITDLPVVGDLLEELTSIDLSIGDGAINLGTQLLGGDLLDNVIALDGNGVTIDTGLGLPALFGGDALGLLDLEIDLGDGLGLGADLLGQDLLDLDALGTDGLGIDLLGQDVMGGGAVVDGVLDAVAGDGGLVDGVLGGDLLGGGLLDVTLGGDGLADVDLLGNDLVGDGALLEDIVGDGGVVDIIPDEIIDVNLLSDGEPLGIDLLGEDVLGGEGLGGDLLGGDLLGDANDALDALGEGDIGGAVEGLLGGAGNDLLDVELGGDELLGVDALGADVIGDGGLLADVVGDDCVLGDALPHEVLDVNIFADGEVLGVEVLGQDVLGGDLLGDALGDAADELLDDVGESLDADCICDAMGDAGDALGEVSLGDVLPDVPADPVLPNLFGGWH